MYVVIFYVFVIICKVRVYRYYIKNGCSVSHSRTFIFQFPKVPSKGSLLKPFTQNALLALNVDAQITLFLEKTIF